MLGNLGPTTTPDLIVDATTGRLAIGGYDIGDTGWRNIAPLNGWTIQGASGIRLRREGRLCSLWIGGGGGDGLNGLNAVNGPFFIAPVGFTPGTGVFNARWYTYLENNTTFSAGYCANNEFYLPPTPPTTAGFRVVTPGFVQWYTDAPWPTSLPGTPVG